jgi:glycosyltransferase involved in cell wall biosynthesis
MRASTPQRPLRLLFLTDTPITVSGGSERFLRNLVNGLAQQGFLINVVHLCEEPSRAAQIHQASIPAAIDVRYLPCGAVYGGSGLRAYRSLKRRVLDEGFHVIQSQHENADVINALLPRGPLDAIKISNRRDTGFLKSRKLRLASRLLNHRFDRIVAPTTAVLDAVAATESAPRKRMLCIPNGVDASRFHPADASTRERTRADLGLASDALSIGCVANLLDVKRHVDLIDAFALVRNAFPQAQLLLIGDGPLRETIMARAREHRVEHAVYQLGSRKDVDELLPAFDVFALASDTEGLSNAILEAQACGLPVVATRTGGNPDLVEGDCGMLVPVRDPVAIAKAVGMLLGNLELRKNMGAAARARVMRRHSLEAMTRAYATLYRECAHVR